MPLSRNRSTPDPMTAHRYPDHPAASLMPNMTEEEFLALKADIKQHGLREPILIFKGQVVDGRHRLRACHELGIEPLVKNLTCPEHDLPGLVRSLNFHRRHLTREQKQTIIRQQLKETPDKSDRQIAKDLGVSNQTVSIARNKMVADGQLCESHSSIGADGKTRKRPAKPEPKPTRPEPENGAQGLPAADSEPRQPESESLDEWLQQILKPLSPRARQQVEKGIKRLLARLRGEYQREVQQGIDKGLADGREQLAAQRERLTALEQEAQADRDAAKKMLQGITAYMTEEEYNLIRGLLHPDRHPGDNQDRYTRAFEVFKRLKEMINPRIPVSVLRARGWAS